MLIQEIYCRLKSFVPLPFQRLRARRILAKCAGVWPIHEGSGRTPEQWRGWPQGREFALVLAHEVEGLEGLKRCRQLAEIEMEHGFRSTFYFLANGEYEVPRSLLDWLRENGFGIGVFVNPGSDRGCTAAEASAINQRLAEWGATGVKARGTRRQLDWLHALKVDHAGSTIDVDPFNPDRGCAQTVFPFWVTAPDLEADALRRPTGERAGADGTPGRPDGKVNPAERGFIELPETLARPFDLFVVQQERGIDCWKKKLRWLAGRRAMALLETEPDHMSMPGETPGAREYPVQYYRDFLAHVSAEYAGRYWAAVPREVADFCRTFRPKQARPPRRVAMLSYSYYKSDNRVRRYAETLARQGDHVRALCIGNEEQMLRQRCETVNGVRMERLVARPAPGSPGWLQAWRLAYFFWRALRYLGPSQFKGGCDLLHIHNVPDFLVFAGVRLKWRGTRIILDIHDIMPELYESKFQAGPRSVPVALLRLMEKWACGFADHVIVANHIWKDKLLERSAPVGKVTALVNNVDLELFTLRTRTRSDDRIILIYPGTLNRHQGLDLAVQAVKSLLGDFPRLELHIYGGGPALSELKRQVEELGLGDHIRFFPGVFLDDIPELIANADIGIVPKRAEGFGDQAYSTKIMEFMSQRLPVVLSRTRIDSLYFNDSVAAFFESGNHADLAEKIRRVIQDEGYRKSLAQNGYAYARAHSWEQMKSIYLNLADRLTSIRREQPGHCGGGYCLTPQVASLPSSGEVVRR